ncbi:hypothetical protein RJJ37_29735 [Rhizobium redzepovicii]|uniref:Uncharacterized protein n=1 Tax=Rhizobium redzepovicii TaxID=2867518 RepID=A0AAW8PBG1_9HYPH|nr:hypothetical protein [Rhizobium redzepovicii]MDR9763761.1 hypothetical protein [Rhizobium redzepovicii]
MSEAHIHDIAVIWDEDHDTRVLTAMEALYLKGLLSPVLLLGERKGALTLITASDFSSEISSVKLEWWRSQVEELCAEIDGDSWTLGFGTLGLVRNTIDTARIIHDAQDKVSTYLSNIYNLWKLGTWPLGEERPLRNKWERTAGD